jgi:hypothetical protein
MADPAPGLANGFRDAVRAEGIGQSLQGLAVFGGAPDISAARYHGDGQDLDTYKLPFRHSFAPFGEPLLGGAAPYVEMTLGYARATARTPGDVAQVDVGLRARFRVLTALAGMGLDFPVGQNSVVRPIVLGGYSRISTDVRFEGAAAPLFEEITGGILSRIRIDTALVGGALEFEHRRQFRGDLRFTGRLRYSQLRSLAVAASDAAFRVNGSFGVGTGSATLNGPLGMRVAGGDLRWIAFGGGTVLVGEERRALGFGEFAEIGAGLELAAPGTVPGVEGISLRGSGIFGHNVTGWSVGVSLEF